MINLINSSEHVQKIVIKEVIFCSLGFCLSYIVFLNIFVHVKVLQSEKKTQIPQQSELQSPTELPVMPGLESSLHLRN